MLQKIKNPEKINREEQSTKEEKKVKVKEKTSKFRLKGAKYSEQNWKLDIHQVHYDEILNL